MSVRYLKKHAALEDVVTVEEAEGLSAWLLEHPKAGVHMGKCTHLHSAALQVLLALRPPLAAPPPDPVLARLLADAIALPT